MSFLGRAWRYCARKPIKTVIIFVVLTVMATVVMGAGAVTRSADRVSEDIDAKTGSGFVLEINPQYNFGTPRGAGNVKASDIEKLAGLDGVQSYVARQNVTADLVNAEVLKPDHDDYDEEREAQFGNAVNVWGVNRSDIANAFRSGSLTLVEGRHLTADDTHKAVIHEDLAKANNLTVGSTLTLKGNKYDVDNQNQSTEEVETEIVGIVSGENTRPVAVRSELYANTVFTDLDTTRTLYQFTPDTEIYQDANFFVAKDVDLEDVAKAAQSQQIDWNNYQLSRSAQYLAGITGAVDGVKSIMRNTTIGATVFAAAVVALVMFLWLNERKKETGTLLSIGVNKGNIAAQYFFELILIAIPAFITSYFAASGFAQWMGNTTLASVNESAEQEMAQAGQFGADMESAASVQTLDSLSVGLTAPSVVQAVIICVAVIAVVVAITSIPMLRKSPRAILVDTK
ncbi:ABC transporter permease [Flaviflexus massiliensis]|uniref:ABC transporter permease n=1 Tax=Flaviflexus massiliensis TaxID=1522309 RepID=UPI00097D39D3|nr:ABC transporter permease [Flaviflexus massiliensis]